MTNNRTLADRPCQGGRDFELIVFGATGLTGRLVVEQLAGIDGMLRRGDAKRGWAVAGRDRGRIARILAELSLGDVEIIVADLDDTASLQSMAARAAVVLNLAGPYTSKAQHLIGTCIEVGASYVDLSGEIPLLRRVIDRFDEPARQAGVQVVQMAGWEAMPADLATLVACRRAARTRSSDGPGAAGPIRDVAVSIDFTRMPDGGVPFNQSVSAGTMASVIEMLDDADAGLVGRAGGLLPKGTVETGGSLPAGISFDGSGDAGRVSGPVVPVAFLNPPIVHRTAALLAAERGQPYRPAVYREGVDTGSADGFAGLGRKARAFRKRAIQRMAVGLTRLPLPVRRAIAGQIRKRLPNAGTGPSGSYLHDWSWTVEARATSFERLVGTAIIGGTGHPGYTATAAIIVEVALSMTDLKDQQRRCGCITPALTIGASAQGFHVGSLNLR